MVEGGRRRKWEMEVDRVVLLRAADGAPPTNALELAQYIFARQYSGLEYSEHPNNTKN